MCDRSSSVMCWCNHSLNCKLGGISSANRCAFREKSYGCNRSSWKTSMILRCNSPNSHAISPELLHSSRFTAAIMAYPMVGVRMAFLGAVRVSYTFCLTDTMLQSSKQIGVWKTSATIIACSPRHRVCTQWSFRGPVAHCALITPNNAFNRRGKQHFWEMC